MNVKPESPLPWADDPTAIYYQIADLHYIVHACNAYPKLIEFLQSFADWETDNSGRYLIDKGRSILKELGEL